MFTVSSVRPQDKQASFNNMTASNQWANRPASERFWSVQELRDACKSLYDNSEERIVPVKGLDVVVCGIDLALSNRATGAKVRLNNWSFGQLCQRLGAPASYLRRLQADDVAQLLNKYGIGQSDESDTLAIWRHRAELMNDPSKHINTALAVTSEKYGRIPNYQVCEALLELGSDFRVPPARPSSDDPRARPATSADILSGNRMGLSISEGDMIAPSGVYGDDRNIFVFLVNENRSVSVSEHETLYRGFYVENSEVGASALRFTIFDYVTVCGNHIIWGCRNLQEISIRHIGKQTVFERFNSAFTKIRKYLNSDTSREQNAVKIAKDFYLGRNSQEVIEFTSERIKGLSRKAASSAYDLAEQYEHIHGNPNTAWGFASGLTRLSQTLPNADTRDELDRAARKVLQLAGAFQE